MRSTSLAISLFVSFSAAQAVTPASQRASGVAFVEPKAVQLVARNYYSSAKPPKSAAEEDCESDEDSDCEDEQESECEDEETDCSGDESDCSDDEQEDDCEDDNKTSATTAISGKTASATASPKPASTAAAGAGNYNVAPTYGSVNQLSAVNSSAMSLVSGASFVAGIIGLLFAF